MSTVNCIKLNKNPKIINYLILLTCLSLGLLLFWQDVAIAAGGKDLKDLASGAQAQVSALAALIIVIAYIAGIAFSLVGVLQFKAHKDNPQQTPLSKPIIFLIVGALLIFLPTVMKSAGQSIFGGEQKSGNTGSAEF